MLHSVTPVRVAEVALMGEERSQGCPRVGRGCAVGTTSVGVRPAEPVAVEGPGGRWGG